MKGNVVLVTGGSRGIGYAIAERFAEAEAHVVITYRNESAGQEAVKRLAAAHPSAKISGYASDASDAKSVDELFAAVIAEAGRVDVLVNNAGITRDTLILRMKEEDWDAVIDANLKGAFLCCRAAAKAMLKARKGTIVNIASVVGQIGNAGQVNYSASKGGLIAMTKSLARELGSRAITVNTVAPGYIETDMTEKLPEAAKAKLLENVPLARLGSAREVAEAVYFLASPAAAYITGETLSVNGGLAMV